MLRALFSAALSIVAVAAGIAGCQPPTNFTGNPMFPGGIRGCWDYCKAAKMELAAYVLVGEYSTACACRPPGPGATAESDTATNGAVVAATAGVEVQRQRIARQQQMQQTHFHPGVP